MIGTHVRLDLDLDNVANEIDRGWPRMAKSLGFTIRGAAQSSIRDRRGASSPGSPPHSHDGTLRRFLIYGYDRVTRSVVIGPKLLKRKSKDAAEALEEGGLSQDARGRTLRIRQRPFMRPAMGRVINTDMARILTDSLRGQS